MMKEYPKMVYKLGGDTLIDGKYFECVTIDNKDDESKLLKSGYSLSPAEEKKVKKKRKSEEEGA